MSHTPTASRSPLRLLLLGVVLLWVASPLLLGGLITAVVRAHNGGGIGWGLGVVLVLWGLLALLVLLAGFAALVTAVVAWARRRSASTTVHTERHDEGDEQQTEHDDE